MYAPRETEIPLPVRTPAVQLTPPGRQHTVLPGDTISSIEARYLLPPGTLLRLNPFVASLGLVPGTRLHLDTRAPGRALLFGGTVTEPAPPEPEAPEPPAPFTDLAAFSAAQGLAYDFKSDTVGKVPAAAAGPEPALGSLSRTYESSSGGPGTVSSGVGDHGGVSYGLYQFASKFSQPEAFLQHEGKAWLADFKGLVSGTAEFSTKWKAVAKRDAAAFGEAQHQYIERAFYQHNVALIKRKTGYDVLTKSRAVQNAVWSTAVQNGADTRLVVKLVAAQNVATLTDEQLLKLIYAERGRTNKAGTLVHFASSSAAFQKQLKARFKSELAQALKQLPAQ